MFNTLFPLLFEAKFIKQVQKHCCINCKYFNMLYLTVKYMNIFVIVLNTL